MAISGLINSSSATAVVNFLNSLFGDKLTASKGYNNNNIYIYIDGNTIMNFNIFSGGGMYDRIYNSNGQIILNNDVNSSNCRISVIASSNGFIIESKNSSKHALYFLTFNSDGTAIYGGTPMIGATSYEYTSFKTTTWDTTAISTTATSLQATSTSLVNLLYQGNFGQNSIAEKGYFALYNQYPSTIGIATLNNKNYIVAGCFYISD